MNGRPQAGTARQRPCRERRSYSLPRRDAGHNHQRNRKGAVAVGPHQHQWNAPDQELPRAGQLVLGKEIQQDQQEQAGEDLRPHEMTVVGDGHRHDREEQRNRQARGEAMGKPEAECEERDAERPFHPDELVVAERFVEQVEDYRRQPLVGVKRVVPRLGEGEEYRVRYLAVVPDHAADGHLQPEIVAGEWRHGKKHHRANGHGNRRCAERLVCDVGAGEVQHEPGVCPAWIRQTT